ncbi:hypothetical protein GI582_10985 [Sulfitobacter sp. BDSS02]|nr:hypothetical protein [Sulfitobacter sp. BDSS02]
MMYYDSTLKDFEDWLDALKTSSRRLADKDRSGLVESALEILQPGASVGTEDVALAHGAGPPIAPLFNYIDEARFWAGLAEIEEIEAYCLACFDAMPVNRQADFLDYVHRRVSRE